MWPAQAHIRVLKFYKSAFNQVFQDFVVFVKNRIKSLTLPLQYSSITFGTSEIIIFCVFFDDY